MYYYNEKIHLWMYPILKSLKSENNKLHEPSAWVLQDIPRRFVVPLIHPN